MHKLAETTKVAHRLAAKVTPHGATPFECEVIYAIMVNATCVVAPNENEERYEASVLLAYRAVVATAYRGAENHFREDVGLW